MCLYPAPDVTHYGHNYRVCVCVCVRVRVRVRVRVCVCPSVLCVCFFLVISHFLLHPQVNGFTNDLRHVQSHPEQRVERRGSL